jgi:hypothetical protein
MKGLARALAYRSTALMVGVSLAAAITFLLLASSPL